MTLSLSPQSFRLTRVVRAFLAKQEWEDEVSVDGFMAQVSTFLTIHEQRFKLYIEVNEQEQLLSVFIYSPIRIPVGRLRGQNFRELMILAGTFRTRSFDFSKRL